MGATLLPDPLWDLVEPFLPISRQRPHGGRPRVSDRARLPGIAFVLRSGSPGQMLPQQLGCGPGITCWCRLRDWQGAGVWDLIHFALLDWLARGDQLIGRGRSWTVVPSAPPTVVTRPDRIPPTGPSAPAPASVWGNRVRATALGGPRSQLRESVHINGVGRDQARPVRDSPKSTRSPVVGTEELKPPNRRGEVGLSSYAGLVPFSQTQRLLRNSRT